MWNGATGRLEGLSLRGPDRWRSETKATNESGEYSLGQLLCGRHDAGREAGACVPSAPSRSRLRFPLGMLLRALGVAEPGTAARRAAQAMAKGTRAPRRPKRLGVRARFAPRNLARPQHL